VQLPPGENANRIIGIKPIIFTFSVSLWAGSHPIPNLLTGIKSGWNPLPRENHLMLTDTNGGMVRRYPMGIRWSKKNDLGQTILR
jgi:hypothetical protein